MTSFNADHRRRAGGPGRRHPLDTVTAERLFAALDAPPEDRVEDIDRRWMALVDTLPRRRGAGDAGRARRRGRRRGGVPCRTGVRLAIAEPIGTAAPPHGRPRRRDRRDRGRQRRRPPIGCPARSTASPTTCSARSASPTISRHRRRRPCRPPWSAPRRSQRHPRRRRSSSPLRRSRPTRWPQRHLLLTSGTVPLLAAVTPQPPPAEAVVTPDAGVADTAPVAPADPAAIPPDQSATPRGQAASPPGPGRNSAGPGRGRTRPGRRPTWSRREPTRPSAGATGPGGRSTWSRGEPARPSARATGPGGGRC